MATLFRAKDLVFFLMTWPVRIERAFLHKFQDAMFFSSWAFLLLGSPMVLALGIVQDRSVLLLPDDRPRSWSRSPISLPRSVQSLASSLCDGYHAVRTGY